MNDETDYIKLDVGKGWFYHLISQIQENTLRLFKMPGDEPLTDEMKNHLTALLQRNEYIKDWLLRNTDADGKVLLSRQEYQALLMMNDVQLAEVAKILGVSEDSISAMDDEIKNSMTAFFEQVAVKTDEDKKAVFEALDNLWQKGSIYIELSEVAKSTGITIETLRSLDYETQQTIVYEFMMDSSQTARFYDIVNKALAVTDLPNVAKLIGTPVRELRSLPRRIQENVCGAYAMEYDANSTNTDLIDTIREMIAP